MASRKSVANRNEAKSGYNYQKEVKQLKKDIRLKDDKLSLLNKDLKYKQDTIDLLQTGLKSKDDQLQLKDKEIISNEQNLKLLTDKIEILEKHNDELKTEVDKQTKLATTTQKKLSIIEQNNMNLLTQINSLAQNLNNLKNVNMALSSQLTMTMSGQQPQYNMQPQIQPINQQINVVKNNTNANTTTNDSENDISTDNDAENDIKSDSEIFHKEIEKVKRNKAMKKRQSMIPQSKTNISESKKSINRKRSKSGVLKTSKSVTNVNKNINMSEDDHWDGDNKHAGNDYDNNFFGNAPIEKSKKKNKKNSDDYFGAAPVEKEKTKKKKKHRDNGTDVSFDTYLSELESDKLKITRGGKLVAMDYFTDSLYIISSNGYSKGKHEWEIKTLKTGDLTDEIGVCSSWNDLEVNGNSISDMGSSQLGARAVFANDASTGVAFHDAYDKSNKLTYDKKFKKKGNNPSEYSWSKGDVIKVALNLNKWTLKFFLNSKQVGKSIPLTRDLTYYPILCAYGSCSYQVISCS